VNDAKEDDRARSTHAARLRAKGLTQRATLLRTIGREGIPRGEAVVVVCVDGRENNSDGEEAEEEKNTADGGRLYRVSKTTSRRHAGFLAKPRQTKDGLGRA
jgi:hypothetical protein